MGSYTDKPWLACNITLISSDGRGREEVQLKSTPLVFVTHHALSRAAQRFGVRGSEHMITVAESVWDAAFRLINDKGGVENALAAPPDGWRTMMEIMDVRATVVLKRHEKRHALVAATVF